MPTPEYGTPTTSRQNPAIQTYVNQRAAAADPTYQERIYAAMQSDPQFAALVSDPNADPAAISAALEGRGITLNAPPQAEYSDYGQVRTDPTLVGLEDPNWTPEQRAQAETNFAQDQYGLSPEYRFNQQGDIEDRRNWLERNLWWMAPAGIIGAGVVAPALAGAGGGSAAAAGGASAAGAEGAGGALASTSTIGAATLPGVAASGAVPAALGTGAVAEGVAAGAAPLAATQTAGISTLPAGTASGAVPSALGTAAAGTGVASTAGKIAKLLGSVGSGVNAATQQSAQNRIAQNDPYIQRSKLESDERTQDLKNLYVADYAKNPSHSPFNPVAARVPGAQYGQALDNVSSQAAGELATAPQYRSSQLPSLAPGTLEQIGQWAGPLLQLLGGIGQIV